MPAKIRSASCAGSKERIEQAKDDWQHGRFPEIAGDLGCEEREVLRARDGLRAALDGELAVDVFQVRLHGLRRDAQGLSDLLVRLTLGHQL